MFLHCDRNTVLDPFTGQGTTNVAAITSQRNSIGIEIDTSLSELIDKNILNGMDIANERINKRLCDHIDFMVDRQLEKKEKQGKRPKDQPVYFSKHFAFPVVSKAEVDIDINIVSLIEDIFDHEYQVYYDGIPNDYSKDIDEEDDDIDDWAVIADIDDIDDWDEIADIDGIDDWDEIADIDD